MATLDSAEVPMNKPATARGAASDCRITAVGKRRDGGTRYWCSAHHADATAKYGKRGKKCRYADVPAVEPSESLELDLDAYAGGVALWGAVPPVYDTTDLNPEKGIHVHARQVARGPKVIDATFRRVSIWDRVTQSWLQIGELDAIYFMVASVFGLQMKEVHCTHCGFSHLDRDWFAVHPHHRHLCAACGRNFADTVRAVGNPVAALRRIVAATPRPPRQIRRALRLRQADFPGGVQIWGSNPAFIWTGTRVEEEGIHVHAFKRSGIDPEVDDTFSTVEIDGTRLDPSMVRTLMAQTALPHLNERVVSLVCPDCATPQFDAGSEGFTPKVNRRCGACASEFRHRARLRNVVSNPLGLLLDRMAKSATNPRRIHVPALIPETL